MKNDETWELSDKKEANEAKLLLSQTPYARHASSFLASRYFLIYQTR